MSYTIEVTKELFVVTNHYGENNDLHIIMSKKEVQEALKGDYAYIITDITELKINPIKKVSKKYFLPQNWQKRNPKTTTYQKWKEIAESEDNNG
jgi:hypothetical protein